MTPHVDATRNDRPLSNPDDIGLGARRLPDFRPFRGGGKGATRRRARCVHNRSLGVDTTSSTKVRASMEPAAAYDFIDDDTCDPASDMLASLGLQKKPIAKDGNCLFASICDQLEQHLTFQETCDTSTQHAATAVATMRQHIANHMIAYKERFLPFFATDASPIDALVQNCHYMRKMHDACQRNWGDHPELQAAANLYCVCIEVFASTLAGLAVSGHYPFQLPNETDNDYEHRCQELPVIRLHLADEHYSSTCDLVDPLCTPPHTSPIESEADLPSTDSESDAPSVIPTGAPTEVTPSGAPTEVTPSTTPMSVPSAEMPARRAVRCMSHGESSSPLAKRAEAVSELAQQLRPGTTVPLGCCDEQDAGARWPQRHCAFIGCGASGDDNAWLESHLEDCHASSFRALDLVLRMYFSADPHITVCQVCGQGGKLLQCGSCPSSWHAGCLQLAGVSTGTFCCPQCDPPQSSSAQRDSQLGRYTEEELVRELNTGHPSWFADVPLTQEIRLLLKTMDFDSFDDLRRTTGCSDVTVRALRAACIESCDSALTPTCDFRILSQLSVGYLAMYMRAVHHNAQAWVPAVGPSFERRAEEAFKGQLCDANVYSLICFCCARVLPYDRHDQACAVKMHRAMQNGKFLRLDATEAEGILGFDTYMSDYGPASAIEELKDWCVVAPIGTSFVTLLCCPEDRRCSTQSHARNSALCDTCEIPLCKECHISLSKKRLPAMALTNDLWTGHTSRFIYENNVTYMELLCASPVHPAVLSFQVSMHASDGGSSYIAGSKMWRQTVHCHDGTTGASGNITGFMSPWAEILKQLSSLHDPAKRVALPLAGEDLTQVVQVVLRGVRDWRTGCDEVGILASARVRSHIVVQLIEMMIDRDHPAYRSYSKPEVRERAIRMLPGDAPPLEVIAELSGSAAFGHHNGTAEKAAVPGDPPIAAHLDPLKLVQPGMVYSDAHEHVEVDENESTVHALLSLAHSARADTDTDDGQATLNITHGPMQDQLTPWFFVITYCFLFPHGTGLPDLHGKERPRRKGTASSRVDFVDVWTKLMVQRAEGQWRRDLTFPFAAWMLVFKTSINLGKTFFAATRAAEEQLTGGEHRYTTAAVASAAKEIYDALQGTYTSPAGHTLPVNGHIQKVRYMTHLSPLARKLLTSYQFTNQKIEGTQEVRSIMRKELEAFRVRYGHALMWTISPNEKHNALMIRLSRTMSTDPILAAFPELAVWGRQDKPSLEVHSDVVASEEFVDVFVALDGLAEELPDLTTRMRILAHDPLASVYGFRVLVQVALRTLLGVRVCSNCPTCSESTAVHACMDEFGSVGEPQGGIFGIVEAYYGSIESQKAGSLHLHLLVFLSWMYQHKPLEEIAVAIQNRKPAFYEALARFKGRTASESLADVDRFPEHVVDGIEAEHARAYRSEASLLLYGPRGDALSNMSAAQWRSHHEHDSDNVRMLTNHHIHPKQLPDNVRSPMPGCIAAGKPGECKHQFPKDNVMFEQPTAVCPGIAKRCGLKSSGDRSMLGALLGPRNCSTMAEAPSLGATALRTNQHVTHTFRVPLCPDAACHSPACAEEQCHESLQSAALLTELMGSMDRAQCVQCGYVCDYATKKQPIATKEIGTFKAGQDKLQEQLRAAKASRGTAARRATQRMAFDFVGRGTFRRAVENANLVAFRRPGDVTAAESMKSAPLVKFNCKQFAAEAGRKGAARCCISLRGGSHGVEPSIANFGGILYGHRGQHRAIHTLSAYEFVSGWTFVPAKSPKTLRQDCAELTHCMLTPAGRETLSRGDDSIPVAGEHHVIRGPQGRTHEGGWIALSEYSPFRHEYVIVQRTRPRVPWFAYPFPWRSTPEQQAERMLAYFRPWVSMQADAGNQTLHRRQLRTNDEKWTHAWCRYIDGLVPSDELKRYIQNFRSVHSTREHEELAEASASRKDATTVHSDTLDVSRVVDEIEDRTHHIWGAMHTSLNAGSLPKFVPPQEWAGIEKAARKTQRSQSSSKLQPSAGAHDPVAAAELVRRRSFTVSMDIWWRRVREELTPNAKQLAFVDILARQARMEEADLAAGVPGRTPPCRMFLTGAAGTGKSFIIKAARMLFDELGWMQGQEYQFTAYQATTANQADGQTLHYAFGVPVNRRSARMQIDPTECRWVFIDEISMVDAELLGRCERNTRTLSPKSNPYRYDTNTKDERWWAGMNIIFVGDFVQLRPRGTSLATIPSRLRRRMIPSQAELPAQLALDLLWGDDNLKLLELTEQVRVTDEWYHEVLTQWRCGSFSAMNRAFFCGNPTTHPGSYLESTRSTLCGSARCAELIDKPWTIIKQGECAKCRGHRLQRHIHVPDKENPRYKKAVFREALVVTSDNATRCSIAMRRATEHCSGDMRVAVAHDTIKCDALLQHPTSEIVAKKESWLHYHDRRCGNLCGLLPLYKGMKVALTQHIDRKSGKNLLRGRRGTVVGWELDPQEPASATRLEFRRLPRIVYVKFKSNSNSKVRWRVCGLDAGVYPIIPRNEDWFVDQDVAQKGGGRPSLRIVRTQLPLTPAGAATIFSAQGETRKAVIVAGKLRSAVEAYVAASRVHDAKSCLFEEFPDDLADLFSSGRPLCPENEVLLAKLRGEDITNLLRQCVFRVV